MPVELLFGTVVLLLPVAAFSGWYLGRREGHRGAARSGRPVHMSPDYLKGLNYLLNEQPDKAIEVFIRVLQVDDETVETHFALGNLFRRRGEVDRAIRIHQNLIARPTLDPEQRALALLELGVDYMRSGLLDRAESLFVELLDGGVYRRAALTRLVDIYQQEKDWQKAIDYVLLLKRETGQDVSSMHAQFICEQADELSSAGDVDGSRKLLKRALQTDSKCVRASLGLGSIEMSSGQFRHAIDHFKRVEGQNHDFIPEIIAPLITCYRSIDRIEDLVSYLEQLSSLYAGVSPVLALAQLALEQDGVDSARALMVEELRVRPTIRGVDRLIDYSLSTASGDARNNLGLLKEFTQKLLDNKSTYKCAACGFSGRTLHWHCPSCKMWNSIKPIQGIEGA